MTRQIRWWTVAAVALLAAAAILWLRQSAPTTRPGPGAGSVAERPAPATPGVAEDLATLSEFPAPSAGESVPAAEPAPPPVAEEEPPPPPGTVRIRGDEILVAVNGVAIQGKDLLVFGKAAPGKPVTMAESSYLNLRRRAIERELITQAAAAESIALTEDQQRQLDQVRETVLARMDGDPNAVFLNYSGTLEEQADFEQREAAAQLKLNSLLEKKGVPSPYVTDDQVRQFYEAHAAEFAPLPEDPEARATAWKDIDRTIRGRLAPELLAAYQEQRVALISNLTGNAEIAPEPGAP